MSYGVLGYPGINGRFFARYNAAEAGSYAMRLAGGRPFESNQEIETYRWLGMPPGMREWIGGRHERRLRKEVFQIVNRLFEFTLDFSVDDFRRDKTGQINARVDDTANKTGTQWESLETELIAANGICYDGQNFFDTDHVSGDSGTQKNDLAAGDYGALNVGTATDPTAAELIRIIMTLVQHLYTLKDDTGDPINQNARKFAVMVPPTMMAAAIEALKNNVVSAGGGGIQTNTILVSGMEFELIINARSELNWTDKLALFRTDGTIGPFILQEELPLETSWLDESSEEAFKNRRILFGGVTSRAAGYGLWQHAVRATLS